MKDTPFAFVCGSVDNEKPVLTLMISDSLVEKGYNAGAIVREAGKLIQGGGGGQPSFATAGGKNAAGIAEAISKILELLEL